MIEPPELRDGRVVIRHDDPEYGPWVVEAAKPRRRDLWRILRGTYRPSVTLTRSLTVLGTSRVLARVYDPAKMRALLDEPSLLFRDLDA